MKKYWICIAAAVLLTGCAQKPASVKPTNQPCSIDEPCTTDQPTTTSDSQKTPVITSNNSNPADMSGYEGFTDVENQFVQTSLEDALDRIASNEPMLVYFGKTSCPWCVDAIPVLNQVAKQKQALIMYVDVAAAENSGDQLKERLMTLFAGHLEKDEDNIEQFFVPTVAIMINGQVKAIHISTVDSHDAHERKMNEEETVELSQIYEDMIDLLPKE